MLIFVMICNGVIANTMEEPNLLNQENYFRLAAILLATIAVLSKKVFLERTILVLGWVMLIVHTFVQ